MPTITPVLLSGSTSGRNVKAVATATPGTLIHTAVAGSTSFDEVWLYAENTSAASVTLTIEAGGVTSPDDLIILTVPGQSGLVNVIPGNRYNGGVAIRAFASSANLVVLSGNVNRYTP
jgi:hypothetical protein